MFGVEVLAMAGRCSGRVLPSRLLWVAALAHRALIPVEYPASGLSIMPLVSDWTIFAVGTRPVHTYR